VTKQHALVRGWVALQRAWPAYTHVSRILEGEDKHAAWKLVSDLVRLVPASMLPTVGAGPLENFVKRHADDCIEQLERCARRSPRWRKAFKHVGFRPSATAVGARLTALGCIAIERPSQGRPRRSRGRARRA